MINIALIICLKIKLSTNKEIMITDLFISWKMLFTITNIFVSFVIKSKHVRNEMKNVFITEAKLGL